MENKERYERLVEESAETRYDINENKYKRVMTPLKVIARAFTGMDPHLFKHVHDLNYYRGGYPGEDSPPKLDSLLRRTAEAVRFFHFLGWTDRLKTVFEEFGLEVKVAPLNDSPLLSLDGLKKRERTALRKAWVLIYGERPVGEGFTSQRELLTDLMGRAYAVQADICQLADSIKIDAAETVEQECDVKKPHFIKTVQLKFAQNKAEEANKETDALKNAKDDLKEFEEALSILE